MTQKKMSNSKINTRGPSPTKLIELRSQQILRDKLPLHEALFQFYDADYPNLDGQIEFIDKNGSTTIILFFQLKATNKNVNYHDCDIEFLNYCYKANHPCFLFFVDITNNNVYWERINKEYIEKVLGIKDISTFQQKQKRITFLSEKLVDNNVSILSEECSKHYQGLSILAASVGERTAELPPHAAIPGSDKQIIEELRARFEKGLGEMLEKMMIYHAFIYMLTPFYIDKRGEQVRRKLISYLKITDSEERFILEKLERIKLIGREGSLVYVTSKDEAVAEFNHFIDSGKIELSEASKIS